MDPAQHRPGAHKRCGGGAADGGGGAEGPMGQARGQAGPAGVSAMYNVCVCVFVHTYFCACILVHVCACDAGPMGQARGQAGPAIMSVLGCVGAHARMWLLSSARMRVYECVCACVMEDHLLKHWGAGGICVLMWIKGLIWG